MTIGFVLREGATKLRVRLAGPGASVRILGVLSGENVSATIDVEHLAPGAASSVQIRSIVPEGGRTSCRVRTEVAADAVKSDVAQLLRALLLGERSSAEQIPELRIHTDDVAARHGATSRELDSVQLLALRARGLEESDARRLLVRAFAGEVLSGLPAELREIAAERLPGICRGEA